MSAIGTIFYAGKLAKTQQEHTKEIDSLRKSTDENKKCLVSLKLRSTDFMTGDEHKEQSDECREDVFREIGRDRTDIVGMKNDIKDLTNLVAETNSLVRQVIAIQEGSVN